MKGKNSPRWMIFIIDIAIVMLSVWISYLLRFNFNIPEVELKPIQHILGIFLIVRSLGFIIGKTYGSMMRYTSSRDTSRIFITNFVGSLFFIIANLLSYKYLNNWHIIPFSIIILELVFTSFLQSAFRIFVKVAFLEITKIKMDKTNVVIFGAGDSGQILLQAMRRDDKRKYEIIAMIDDDKNKIGKRLEGVKIYGFDQLEVLSKQISIDQLIISVQNLGSDRRKQIIEKAMQHNIPVMNVPKVTNWVDGKLDLKQIKKININDLLGRDVIQLKKDTIKEEFEGKVLLISGAAGSIGSEIARQVSQFNIKKLYLIDQAETPLHDLYLEMFNILDTSKFEVAIADISQIERMKNVFETFRPDIVFHAAAYKHVPLMEDNPSEAIRTNVMGTKIMADLSEQYGVQKFIMISTDKAVNPTNVMGASKRLAEIYIQSLNRSSKTIFTTTRFGNVLGSNGSVIPLFKKQIEQGGPLTITHPEITRYFMTIPEACQLVLEAGSMGKGGEIFIFDMGESVKIVDLAKKMIQLSGLKPEQDIQITYTGLRPGEKLFEELLNNEENTIATYHSQIMIAKVKSYDFNEVVPVVNNIIHLFRKQDNLNIVSKLKQFIPEYVSHNSQFTKLDNH